MPFNKSQYIFLLNDMKKKDSIIHDIIKKYGFLQPTPKRNIFALLIGSIIEQKIKFSLARKLRGNLYRKIGTDNFSIGNIKQLGKKVWKI